MGDNLPLHLLFDTEKGIPAEIVRFFTAWHFPGQVDFPLDIGAAYDMMKKT